MFAVDIGSDAMTHIPSFIKIGSNIRRSMERIHRQTAWRLISLILFIRNKESRLKEGQRENVSGM
jgi:hypothetical protein